MSKVEGWMRKSSMVLIVRLTVVGGTVSLSSSHGTLSLVELGGGNHLHRLLTDKRDRA